MIHSNHFKRFFKNLSWLISLQGLGYIVSFISIPLIISKFGYAKTGQIMTVQSVILALTGISNYSLNFYIPTQSENISLDKTKFLNLWHLAITIRVIFSLILALISTILVFYFFKQYLPLWIFSLALFLPKIINPSLFLNALEKNQKIVLVQLLSKFLFLLTLLILSNFLFVNFALGISEFLIMYIFIKKEKWNLNLAPKTEILSFIKNTATLFLVNLFSLLKPASILPLITYLFGNIMVTNYVLADKVITVFKGVSGASYVSFYPILNKEKLQNSIIKLTNLKKIFWLSLLLTLFVWLFAPILIYLLNDFKTNAIATKILRILGFSIPISILIIPYFSFFLEAKKWKIILFLAFLQLLIFSMGIVLFHHTIFQIAWVVIFSEFVMLLGYFFCAVKTK